MTHLAPPPNAPAADAHPEPVLRRATLADHDLMRSTRLAALEDAPYAFSSTLAQERAMSEAAWQARTNSSAAGEDTVCVLLIQDGASCALGTAVGVLDSALPDVAHLYGMWIAPAARGGDAGGAMVRAIATWAKSRGRSVLVAGVTADNARALAFYRRLGFGPDLPEGVFDDRCEIQLALRDLGDAAI